MTTSLKARMLGVAFGAGVALISGAALAEDSPIPGSISGNIAITTDYIFRGVTQTDKGPAVQGGFDYSLGSFYAGTWASSIEFQGASTEMDFYAGFKPKIGGVTLDLGAVYYAYPDSGDVPGDLDYWEAYAGASGTISLLTLGAKVYYTPDNTDDTDAALYYSGNASLALGSSPFAINGHVGYYDLDNTTLYGQDSYTDWTVGISTTFVGLGLALTYGDTDIDAFDTSQVWFTLSKAL